MPVELPFRIQTEPGSEPVISVDGWFGAPGLCLSHWPGQRTPRALQRDLSTGVALAFAELPAAERARLAEGCTAVVNNHYDTDGLLAAFAVLRPGRAQAHAEALLAAAAAGDLFRFPSEAAFALDRVVDGLADPERSPIAAELGGLEDAARWERATREGLERLPGWLAEGGLEPLRALWEEDLARLREDLAALERAAFDDLVHLDFALWSGPAGAPFDPARHALWGATRADRVLALGSVDGGTTARFLVSTRSFFEPLREHTQPRPDLAGLAARLNEAEGVDPGGGAEGAAWRHQDLEGASPELWFGAADLPPFPERAGDWLAPSVLPPERIKAAVVDALRACFVFPDEDEDEDEGDGGPA